MPDDLTALPVPAAAATPQETDTKREEQRLVAESALQALSSMQDYAGKAKAAGTREVYDRAWEFYQEFCDYYGLTALSGKPAQLAFFIAGARAYYKIQVRQKEGEQEKEDERETEGKKKTPPKKPQPDAVLDKPYAPATMHVFISAIAEKHRQEGVPCRQAFQLAHASAQGFGLTTQLVDFPHQGQ